ncbi:GGDEF domain-containing protein [Legionella fallonii]|nr:GGDEF domain-containing protein [Legionella fallonii]
MFGRLYYLVAVLSTAGIVVLLNLYLLIRSKNVFICGHVTLFITFITVLIANYLVRGIGPSFSAWFYVIPTLSLALVGFSGLLIYSSLSLLMIIGCRIFLIPAHYSLPATELVIIDWINHLVAFIIIVSTLDSLLRERNHYAQILRRKNYALQLEKDKYYYLACFDQLTNLPNRQHFKFNLERIITSLPASTYITLFFMDLDNFKSINDDFGHDAGDYVLLEAAKRLRTCFREKDFVARLGGDEFTALVVHSRDEDISKVIIKRIEHAFKQPFHFKNQIYHSSISIGLATYPDKAKTIDELMTLADQAMYQTKREKEDV